MLDSCSYITATNLRLLLAILPNLEKLYIQPCRLSADPISINDIVKHAPNLTELLILICQPEPQVTYRFEYDEILETIEKRSNENKLTIKILTIIDNVYSFQHSIPKYVFNSTGFNKYTSYKQFDIFNKNPKKLTIFSSVERNPLYNKRFPRE